MIFRRRKFRDAMPVTYTAIDICVAILVGGAGIVLVMAILMLLAIECLQTLLWILS